MRELIRDFVEICSKTIPIDEPIYEFGSFQVKGQEGFADLRPLFLDKKYIGTDMRRGLGVDTILNLHKIDLLSESVGTALLLDTLEHVEFPRKAIKEINRVLKSDGIVIMSSVMNFPIHDYPYDYWRFTPEAFKSLLSIFKSSIIEAVGKENFPHTVIGIGFKGRISEETKNNLIKKIERWKIKNKSTLKGKLAMLIPPLVLEIRRKIIR